MKKFSLLLCLTTLIVIPSSANANTMVIAVARQVLRGLGFESGRHLAQYALGEQNQHPQLEVRQPLSELIRPVGRLQVGQIQAKIPVEGRDSSNWAGSVQVKGFVPVQIIYYVDLEEVKLKYDPATNKVFVKMPPVRYHRPAPDKERAEITDSFKGWARSQSSLDELWQRVRMQPSQEVANRYAQDNLENAKKVARPALQESLEKMIKSIKQDVKVEIVD